MRLIDADTLLPATVTIVAGEGLFVQSRMVHFDEIETAPTVDPVKHGRWIFTEAEGHIRGECSECGALRRAENYCPQCGARMDLEAE